MVSVTAFMAFGLLGGFAYLAYLRKREHLAYGLAGVGVSSFLEGTKTLIDPGTAEGLATFLDILRFTALGVGASFLVYVAVIEGYRYYNLWRERRRAEEVAFQLKIQQRKDEPRPKSG